MLPEATQEVVNRSYRRLLPRLEARFHGKLKGQAENWAAFHSRLEMHFPRLFGLLYRVYGDQYDFFYHLEELLAALAQSWIERPAPLKALDAAREGDPGWYQSNQMLGGVIYVDLFAGDLAGVRKQIPYLRNWG